MVPEMEVPSTYWKSMTPPPGTGEPRSLPMNVAPALANAKTPAGPESDAIRRSVPPAGTTWTHEGIIPPIVDVDIDTLIDVHPPRTIVDDRVARPLAAICQIRAIAHSGAVVDAGAIADPGAIVDSGAVADARTVSQSGPSVSAWSIGKAGEGYRTIGRPGPCWQRRSHATAAGLQWPTDAQKVSDIPR